MWNYPVHQKYMTLYIYNSEKNIDVLSNQML